MKESEKPLEGGPDWRWLRLSRSMSAAASRFKDPVMSRGYRYLKRFNHSPEAEDHIWLQADFPDLYDAHQLFMDRRSECWIVEAMILGGQTPEAIAEYVGSTPDVIKAYETYFFDVRNRRKAEGWIQNRLLKPAIDRGVGMLDADQMLKLATVYCGWETARGLLNRQCLTPEGLGRLKKLFLDEVVVKGLGAAQAFVPNNFNAIEMMNTTLRLAELEHNAYQDRLARKSEKEQESEVFDGMRALLNSVQTGILRPVAVVGNERRVLALEVDHGEDGQGD